MELSTISYTRWCRPDSLVEPMYMPGRLRTASRPSSTWISDPPYSCSTWVEFSSSSSAIITSMHSWDGLTLDSRPPAQGQWLIVNGQSRCYLTQFLHKAALYAPQQGCRRQL